MANVNKSAESWAQYAAGQWSFWMPLNEWTGVDFTYGTIAERFWFDRKSRITRVTLHTAVKTINDTTISDITLRARLYKDDPESGTPIAEAYKTNYKTGGLDFDFSGLALDMTGGYIYTTIDAITDKLWEGTEVGLTLPSVAAITYTDIPALTPSIVQPTGTKQGSGSIAFAWTTSGAGTQKSAELQWSTDGVNWRSLTSVGMVQTYTASAGYFPAGTIYWRIKTLSSYDVESDWVRGSFTVAYQKASVTLTAPTSGSYDGGADINFAWTITEGGGSIVGTQMQISTDNGVTWTPTIDRSTAVTSYSSSSYGKFSAGKVLWQVRVKDSYAGWSDWKQASFTVTYTKASVTLTAPTSGSRPGGAEIAFAWEITRGSGGITGTQMDYSTDDGVTWTNLVNSDTSVSSYTAAAGKFTAGKVTWRVRAKDNYSGWGAYSQASFTVAYSGANVTLTTPTSGSLDGGQKINFAWTIAKGSGSITGTQMDYSTDDGVTWSSLVNSSRTVTSYEAAAGKLPAGKILWRVRARDSYAGWSAYKPATITVTYTKATVTLTSPTSGSRDGAEQITFAWAIVKGSGSITGTQMDYSTDDGVTWSSLVNSSGTVTSYQSSIAQFPAGALKWRVRAKDSYSGWGDYKQASVNITYAAVSQVVPVNTPTSGIYSGTWGRFFTVALEASAPVYEPFTVASATMYWRSGESGEFTAVTMNPDGSKASAFIAQGTFPSGVLQWYAEATDNTGRTTTTPTYTLQVLNAAVEAAPVSPINTLESGSGPIVFRWSYGSMDGSEQSKAEIQYSTDGGETWTLLPEISGSDTRTTVPAGTFPGGTIMWQVRSYNAAGTAGPWSASVSFISFAAPIVAGVTGDGKPFLTITWQTEGQQAYEVEVNGKTYGPYYGEDMRSFTLDEPLPDGRYTVRVRAQNRYGLWSEWAEGSVDVVNVPGPVFGIRTRSGISATFTVVTAPLAPAITQQPQSVQIAEGSTTTFRVEFSNPNKQVFHYTWERKRPGYDWENALAKDDNLTGNTWTSHTLRIDTPLNNRQYRFKLWNDVGTVYSAPATLLIGSPPYTAPLVKGFFPADTGYFLVYRDTYPTRTKRELIGKTYGPDFADRAVLGRYWYKFVQALPGGYYSISSNYGVLSSVECPVIAPLDGGEFIELKLSEDRARMQRFQRRREVVYTNYAGAKYPAAEIGEHETLSGSFDVAYLQTDKEAADAFEALVGEAVILKTPGGQVVVGVLEGYDLSDPRFYKSYRCSLQQMDWGEFVDETGGV